jgi:hypothetical protein
VIARVRAVLRRSGRTIDAAPASLQFGRLEIDEAAREARVDGTDVKLKPREFALLLELANNAGVALSRERLLERVWDSISKATSVPPTSTCGAFARRSKKAPGSSRSCRRFTATATNSCDHERARNRGPHSSVDVTRYVMAAKR